MDPARKKAKVEMFEQVHKLETLINEGPCSGHEAVCAKGAADPQSCITNRFLMFPKSPASRMWLGTAGAGTGPNSGCLHLHVLSQPKYVPQNQAESPWVAWWLLLGSLGSRVQQDMGSRMLCAEPVWGNGVVLGAISQLELHGGSGASAAVSGWALWGAQSQVDVVLVWEAPCTLLWVGTGDGGCLKG